MAAPTKEEREACWKEKDIYWQCIDDNDGDKSKCLKVREGFEAKCTKAWVKYFERRKDYLRYKEKIEKEGFEPINQKS
ncbi:hypothetical protein SNE40_009031 [Patella caerulea]|uniref:Cytochrome c oxidase assembly factor 6 homolog n=1 Tax=Patella caerulea TaxID=87958 RepID=A0AAN8JVN4_PATCE